MSLEVIRYENYIIFNCNRMLQCLDDIVDITTK